MQGIVKAPDQGVPGRLIKINHHVAAENYIKFQPEVNGVHQVERAKNNILLQLGRRRIETGGVILYKIALEPFTGHISGQLVLPRLGLGQGLLRDVSGQNPGVPLGCLGPKKLFQVDGENPVFLMAAGELRQYHIAEKGKMVGFPHKKGIIRGQLIEYQLQISGVLLFEQVVQKGREVRIPALPKGMGKTAGNQLPFFTQVNPVVILNKAHHALKISV